MGLQYEYEIKMFLSRDSWKISVHQIYQLWRFVGEDTPLNRLILGDTDHLLKQLIVKKKGPTIEPNQSTR